VVVALGAVVEAVVEEGVEDAADKYVSGVGFQDYIRQGRVSRGVVEPCDSILFGDEDESFKKKQ
jgi:hypothetical protein